jgi:hypothetical protein
MASRDVLSSKEQFLFARQTNCLFPFIDPPGFSS